MSNVWENLAERSEFWAVVALLILAVLDGQGWIAPGMFDRFWPILIGYAGLRVTSKVGKAAVETVKTRRLNYPITKKGGGD